MPLTKITNTGLADDAVTSDKVADGVISAADVADGTLTNAKLANSDITINGTSIALGASGEIVAGTDWQALTVADGSTTLTTEAGKGYFLDTNAGVIEVFLPTSPTQGDTVILVDYAGTFATNNVIVNTGGVAIDSTVGSDFILSTNNRIAEFVYVNSNKGWLYKGATVKGSTPSQAGVPLYDTDAEYISATGGTVTESGDFKIHTFTGDGCFVVSSVGNPAGSGEVVDYLVVAGGGGSSLTGGDAAGGGGGGGLRYYANPSCNPQSGNPGSPLNAPAGITVTASTYPITVGGGGVGSAASPGGPYGGSGSNSVFSTITSAGGGYGAAPLSPTSQAGQPGGSGGGGGGGGGTDNAGGSGNTPPVSPPQGNNGGNSAQSPPDHAAGGGGGAMAVGFAGRTTPSPANSGSGGAGAGLTGFGASNGQCSSCVQYFSGGGGGGQSSPIPLGGGAGGIGGGTPAAHAPGGATANTGGGGGGGRNSGIPGTPDLGGAAGGKGIVVIRYKFQN